MKASPCPCQRTCSPFRDKQWQGNGYQQMDPKQAHLPTHEHLTNECKENNTATLTEDKTTYPLTGRAPKTGNQLAQHSHRQLLATENRAVRLT